MKKILSIASVILLTCILGACGNYITKSISIISSLQTELESVATHLNDIQVLEGQLQSRWEYQISQDPTFTSFTKEEGLVFDNITQRLTLLQHLQQSLSRIKQEGDEFSKLKHEKLSLQEMQIASTMLTQITSLLDSYIQESTDAIRIERTFFKNNTKEFIISDQMSDALTDLNVRAQSRQILLEQLSDPIESIDKPLRIAKARVEALK